MADADRPGPRRPDARAARPDRLGAGLKRLGAAAAPYQGVGRDHLWIWPDEVRQIIRSAATVGQKQPLRAVAGRLTRFHLIDNSRTVGECFGEKDVRRATMQVWRTRGERASRSFACEGRDHSVGMGDTHGPVEFGVEGTIGGTFVVDTATSRITRMRAHGTATA